MVLLSFPHSPVALITPVSKKWCCANSWSTDSWSGWSSRAWRIERGWLGDVEDGGCHGGQEIRVGQVGSPSPAAPVRSMEARRSRGSGGPGGCHGGQEIQQTFSCLLRWIPPLPPRLLRHPLPLINTATSPVAPFSRRPMLPPSLRLAPPASFPAVPSGGLGFHQLMVPCVGEGREVLVKGGYGGAAAIDDTPTVIVVLPGGSEVDSITGKVREGEIMAVLGASSSGKSTLVDALADRIARDCLQGSVSLNGKPLEGKLLKSISAYVMQDDLLFPMLTVEETLMFSADFRLPRTLSPSKKKARVQALIDQLGLRTVARTIIGDEGHRGVSSGERRRVSIGTDIIHDPIILSLDEPTSGLDSTSALMVVSVRQRKPRRRFSS